MFKNLKNISENLNQLMLSAEISSSELARKIGIPATTIKRIRNNETNTTIETLLPIAQYFGVTISELIGDVSSKPNLSSSTTVNRIPLLTWKECSNFSDITYSNCTNHIFTECQISDRGFALKVENDDFFPQNGILIVEPQVKPDSGDYIIVHKVDQQLLSIRKYINEMGQIYLKPLVKGIEIQPLTDEFKVLGVILQYKMELHSKSVRI